MTTQNKQRILIATLVLVAGISWIPYLQTLFPQLSFGDEGYVVQSAYRIFLGQVPYRDFFTAGTPGAYYYSALFMALFGPTLLAVRLGTLVIAAVILLCVCLILQACGNRSRLSYLLAAVYLIHFGGPYWFLASHHWVGLALCLLSLFLLLPGAQNAPSPLRIVLAGACAAATALTLQHLGGLWLLCVGAAFLGFPPAERRRYSSRFAIGILLLAIPVGGYLVMQAGFSTLFYDLVTFPLTQYHKIQAHQGFDLSFPGKILGMISTAWQTQSTALDWARIAAIASLFGGVMIVSLLPLFGLAGLGYLWRKKSYPRPVLLLLGAFFAANYLTVLFRITDHTLVFAAPAALLLLFLAIDQLRGQLFWQKPVLTFDRLWLGLFICVIATTLSYHLMAPKALTATPAGPVYSLSNADLQTLQKLDVFFAQRQQRNETVYCFPYAPMLYFLFQTENPTRHDTLVYPMATDAQRAEVIEQLNQSNNQWVILTTQVEGDPFVRYLEENYQAVEKLPLALVLKKK